MSKEINFENYKSVVNIKVRYDDLDTLGHVNNKTYLSYLEESRIKYMTDVLGLKTDLLDFDVVVGRVDIKYLAPLFLIDNVSVYTRIARIGEKSYDFECWVVTQNGNEIKPSAYAIVTLVSVDKKTGKTKPNEKSMIDSVLEFEKIKPEFAVNKSI
jgi:acyl-CoA thioester hydrolase